MSSTRQFAWFHFANPRLRGTFDPAHSCTQTNPPTAKQLPPTAGVLTWQLFDFDYTIVDDNSDTWIHRCAPGGQLPSAVRDSYVAPDWIGYMNRVLSHLAGATERTNGGGTGGGVAAAKDKQGDAAAAACVSPDAIRAELEVSGPACCGGG